MRKMLFFAVAALTVASFGSVRAASDPMNSPEFAQGASMLESKPLFGRNLENADSPEGVWSMNDAGELTANADQVIWTKEKYGSFICTFEFKLSPKTNGGFLIQCLDKKNWIPNTIEIQLLDDYGQEPSYHSCGSIYGFQAPTKNATKQPGEWNKMKVMCVGRLIKIWLNGEKINEIDTSEWTDNEKSPAGTDIEGKFHGHALAAVESYGFLGFQGLHGNAPMVIRNARVQAGRYLPDTSGYEWFNPFGKKLEKAEYDPEVWSIDDEGVLGANKDNFLWSKDKYSNFVLDLEFKNTEKSNSGIFFKCTDKEHSTKNSMEVQVFDSFGSAGIDFESNGAIYGRVAPVLNVVKAPGEWNRMTVLCAGNWIFVFVNGELSTIMNKSDYKTPDKNLDGTDVKPWIANLPPAEMKNHGYIGLQGLHGKEPVVYRNIKMMTF